MTCTPMPWKSFVLCLFITLHCLAPKLLTTTDLFLVVTVVLFIYLFFKYKFIYFNWRLNTLQYCIGFAIHQHECASIVSPLSECHTVGSIQYFSGWIFFFFTQEYVFKFLLCLFMTWSLILFGIECYSRVHLSIHFGFFQGLIINNKAALSTYVQVFL